MKNLTITLCFLFLANLAQSQNLAGTTFNATMGVMDQTVPCMVDAGTQYGLDRWTNNSGGCPGDATCGIFTNIEPNYNTFEFKNIVNVDACITLDVVTGSCGLNTGFWIVDGTYVPSPPGSGTDPCGNNTLLQSSTFGGTNSVSFEAAGCSVFSINFHNGGNFAQMCTYEFSIQPDLLLDLRCGSDPAACIEKVTIGGTPVPTMTQWGLFLFGLIVLTLGVVTLYNMTAAQTREQV